MPAPLPRSFTRPLAGLVLLLAGWLAAVSGDSLCGQVPTPAGQTQQPQKIEIPGIDNSIQLNAKLFSGSDPHSEIAYAELAQRGIKTIISVDGAVPNVATAEKYGLRYVHIPIGYGGITPEQQMQLVKTAREIPGPIFIHCHHGKHRGPAAAAIAWLGTNPSCTAEQAKRYLSLAGTDPKYEGLFAAVQQFQHPTAEATAAIPFDFPAKVQASGVTEAMIHIDHAWDNLKQFREAKWSLLANHPDVSPAHEALQLVEAFREFARLPEVMEQAEPYRQHIAASLQAAESLEQALRQPHRNDDLLQQIETSFQLIKTKCTDCHQQYRD